MDLIKILFYVGAAGALIMLSLTLWGDKINAFYDRMDAEKAKESQDRQATV